MYGAWFRKQHLESAPSSDPSLLSSSQNLELDFTNLNAEPLELPDFALRMTGKRILYMFRSLSSSDGDTLPQCLRAFMYEY